MTRSTRGNARSARAAIGGAAALLSTILAFGAAAEAQAAEVRCKTKPAVCARLAATQAIRAEAAAQAAARRTAAAAQAAVRQAEPVALASRCRSKPIVCARQRALERHQPRAVPRDSRDPALAANLPCRSKPIVCLRQRVDREPLVEARADGPAPVTR